ncbi:MAG: SAM-dependent methyltransferase [Pseudomonadota bacterium]
MKTGTLYLIPVPLGASSPTAVLPLPVLECAQQLKHFVVENAKSARVFLKTLPSHWPLQDLQLAELNEHTARAQLSDLLAPLRAGNDLGLLSEAGCPAIADPGADLVALAQSEGIRVAPLIGPSSILLALMGSGLSGQQFAFHGYLPVKTVERQQQIRHLEQDSRVEKRAQIFIETPYRNQQMLATLLEVCAGQTLICVASEISLPAQQIRTQSVAAWRTQTLPEIDRRPTVFILQADFAAVTHSRSSKNTKRD